MKYHYDICWAESESSGAEGPVVVLGDLGESVSPWMIIGHGSGILHVHPQHNSTRQDLSVFVYAVSNDASVNENFPFVHVDPAVYNNNYAVYRRRMPGRYQIQQFIVDIF